MKRVNNKVLFKFSVMKTESLKRKLNDSYIYGCNIFLLWKAMLRIRPILSKISQHRNLNKKLNNFVLGIKSLDSNEESFCELSCTNDDENDRLVMFCHRTKHVSDRRIHWVILRVRVHIFLKEIYGISGHIFSSWKLKESIFLEKLK